MSTYATQIFPVLIRLMMSGEVSAQHLADAAFSVLQAQLDLAHVTEVNRRLTSYSVVICSLGAVLGVGAQLVIALVRTTLFRISPKQRTA